MKYPFAISIAILLLAGCFSSARFPNANSNCNPGEPEAPYFAVTVDPVEGHTFDGLCLRVVDPQDNESFWKVAGNQTIVPASRAGEYFFMISIRLENDPLCGYERTGLEHHPGEGVEVIELRGGISCY